MLTTMLALRVPVSTAIQNDPGDEVLVRLMLRVTALTSFSIYLLVFVSRPMQQPRATALTRKLLNNRRYLGIAFAGAHLVHPALIIGFVCGSKIPLPTPLVGGTACLLLSLMLITSLDAPPAAAIGIRLLAYFRGRSV